MNASEFMVQRLYEWGIRRIYGYPGDGINGFFGALNKAREKIEFIQTRHEEIASYMACAHAKLTGEIGVCTATSGPGAIHLLNGLYDAKMDHVPVLAIIGQQATFSLGADYQQEVDLISLYKDVANEYVHMASNPMMIQQLTDRAIRIAKANRTVTCIILPRDVQEQDYSSPPRKHGSSFTGMGYTMPVVLPPDQELQRAADILNSGKKVAMLVGAGALGATQEVEETAEKLGAGVAKALLGKAVMADDVPYCVGPIGLLGSKPSWDLMMECDTFFMIGSSFPYSEFLPKPGQARGVQIDIKARMLGLRYPMDINLEGDAALVLRKLLPLLNKKDDRSWQQKMEAGMKEWWQVLEARAMHSANPVNPQRVFWELSPKLPDNCIVTSDSGTAANWYARDLKFRTGMKGTLSGGLATMCPGLPYAVAAKMAFPDRVAVATVGDGAMQMIGNASLIDAKKYYKKWKDPRLVVVVLNNRDLNQVTWEQRVMNMDPKFEASQDIPAFSYAEYAKILGLVGIEVTKPEQLSGAFDEAFGANRPAVVDVHCDPDTPPLPPHIKLEQMQGMASSIVRGDPNTVGIVTQSAKEMMSTLLK